MDRLWGSGNTGIKFNCPGGRKFGGAFVHENQIWLGPFVQEDQFYGDCLSRGRTGSGGLEVQGSNEFGTKWTSQLIFFISCFVCSVLFGAVWFGKHNFNWLVRFSSVRTVKHRFGRSLSISIKFWCSIRNFKREWNFLISTHKQASKRPLSVRNKILMLCQHTK